ncbi:MAG: RNA polymerase sigma-70 factor [Actinomycetota bacterium]|nr:RNA polymerase sigma-70 factor [Actinomycetota bacterium]
MTADRTAMFEDRRGMLLGMAYRMLGTMADAEDAVQDVWGRWSRVDPESIENVDAYLVRAVTNASLNRLRSARARREGYVGPWLPEPVLTEPSPEERAELADSVSMALLVVLETLSPLERAVFVLHDVFGFTHEEVAGMLDRSPAAVRQLATRARAHVHARRPRYPSERSARERTTRAFLDACRSGSVDRLLAVLSPDVVLTTDGGGKATAAGRPLSGAERVARFLLGAVRQAPLDAVATVEDVNGGPGLVVRSGGSPVLVGVVELEGDRVREIRFVRNPDKLGLRRLPVG